MTLHTLLLIILWFIIAVLFIAIIVLTFIWGRSTIKDDSSKALVLVKTGSHISQVIKAKVSERSNKGHSFMYKNKVVFVPATYEEIYIRNKRMIFINRAGQLIASPFSNDISLSTDERDSLIYELVSSHIGADAVRNMKGKTSTNIIVIAIVAFIVGALVVYGFNYYQDTVSQRQTKTQQPTIQQPIEVR